MKVVIVCLIIVLTGCDSTKWQVVCDSGFSTGPQGIAFINSSGIIEFGESAREKRKMLPNEICKQSRVDY